MERFLLKPGDLIQELRRQSPQKQDLSNDWGVLQAFESFLASTSSLSLVPLMMASSSSSTFHQQQNGSLVRIRCMVQDVFGNELYISVSPSADETYKFGASFSPVSVSDDEIKTHNLLLDRTVLACVPIPGETNWVIESIPHPPDVPLPREKTTTEERQRNKRTTPEPQEEDEENEDEETLSIEQQRKKITKMPNTQERNVSTASISTTSSAVPAFIVKTYGKDDSDLFKIGEAYEFVGILEFSYDITMEISDEFPESFRARNPPSSLTPRIHAITFRKLEIGNGHPDLIPNFHISQKSEKEDVADNVLSFPNAVGHVLSSAPIIRQHIITFLSSVLGGDLLASEYLLLALISRISSRKDSTTIGKFSLNLTRCTNTNVFRNIMKAIESICTKVISIPLTIENLNSKPLSPFKDYTQERLIQTPLQTTSGTVILIDETKLKPGKLNEPGVKNIEALKNIARFQRITLDFQFHTSDFMVDNPIIVISEGRSLIDTCDCVVPLNPLMPFTEFIVPSPLSVESFLSSVRLYLSILRELTSTIEPNVANLIQNHFVACRKSCPTNSTSGQPTVNEDTLHYWMTTARLVSLSFGENTISTESWNHMLSLDKNRLSRF